MIHDLNIDFKIPEDMEKCTKTVITDYLNTILVVYGPPCEFCQIFQQEICTRKCRPRRYRLEIGPFANWTLKKHCSCFESKDEDVSALDKKIEESTARALDSTTQTFCS